MGSDRLFLKVGNYQLSLRYIIAKIAHRGGNKKSRKKLSRFRDVYEVIFFFAKSPVLYKSYQQRYN